MCSFTYSWMPKFHPLMTEKAKTSAYAVVRRERRGVTIVSIGLPPFGALTRYYSLT
jgi:hypothetical protein